jgi:SAM-dependent methyltransferase
MVSARAYPEWLEAWWIRQACQRAGTKDAEAAVLRLAGAVQKLSDLFTVDRPVAAQSAPPAKTHFPDYGADTELAVAYGLFFFPQNFVRARLPLAEAVDFRGWKPLDQNETRPVRVLDLGAGAGAAGLGAASFLRERGLAGEVQLTSVDRSPDSLARLATLARENAAHLPGLRVRTVTQNALEWVRNELPRAEESYDLIVLGFALNEMLPASLGPAPRLELAGQLRRALAPRGLLLILEPSLRETAGPLQELSDALCARAAQPPFPRWGPYLGERACPLRAEGKFWNHEVRRWSAPGSLSLLNRKLWREIGELRFAYALHGCNAPAALPGAFAVASEEPGGLTVRLVSPFHLRKGGFVAACVATDGVKYTLDLQSRGLPKDEIARLGQIERGDILALRGLQLLGTPRMLRLPSPSAIAARYHPE